MTSDSATPPEPAAPPTADAPAPRGLWRILGDSRIRNEILVVVAHRVVEFGVIFVSLKLLTNLLGKAEFGEYTLLVTTVALMNNVFIMPMNQAYLRYYHQAYAIGAVKQTGLQMGRWYLWATLGPAALAALLTFPASRWFEIGVWSAAALGASHVAERWRNLSLEICDLRRERLRGALYSMGYQCLSIAVLVTVIQLGAKTAAAALFATALLACAVAVPGLWPEWSRVRLAVDTGTSELPRLVRTFGVPAAILLVFQWVQSFVDRYLLAGYVSKEAAATYLAAAQVFGAPFLLMINVMSWLAVPVAFRRAPDASDPARLWSADTVVLAGVLLFLCVGVLTLPFCYWLGPWLLVKFTNPEYRLSGGVITAIAATRFVQNLALLLQVIFSVHQQMGASMILRVLGALVTVPLCWWGVVTWDTPGAAYGALAGSIFFVLLQLFGPTGAFWLMQSARRNAH
jgi:O-antigen/teichoic acid export membrane protein